MLGTWRGWVTKCGDYSSRIKGGGGGRGDGNGGGGGGGGGGE